MSSRGRFLRLALIAPLVGPVVGLPLLLLYDVVPGASLIGILLVGSESYAWTSYLAVAGGVLVWSRGRTDTALEHAAWILPRVYAPIAGLHVAAAYNRAWFSASWWADVVFGGLLAFALGCVYALIVLLVAERFSEATPVPDTRKVRGPRAGT